MVNLWNKIEPVLTDVSRPGRYVGNELHSIHKDWDKTEISFALAFPDVYEIGMSHLGLQILYHVLNQCDWIVAERVYAPWIDMEEQMREKGISLFSLESKRAIRDFDIFGITLQYELHYTNILNIINLSRVPLRSHERDEKDPFVIAGGPCAFNPEPLAGFLDAVAMGDGEEVIIEIAEVVLKGKRECWDRNTTLKAISRLKSVYVPSLYDVVEDSKEQLLHVVPKEEDVPSSIQARTLASLDKKNYPSKPLVPLIEIIHDRFSMEIMRGCTRGCRFCNAGMLYRPVRERSVDDLVKQAEEIISNTGYDEISLVSLSSSDYRFLPELLIQLKNRFSKDGISVSFPSLRPDSFTPDMADLAGGLRRSGITLAPEAGTQRLRDVINKNTTEDDLLRAVEIAFQRNWSRIKLYFMIGLPTETDEDLMGIVQLVQKVVETGRKYGRKDIIVSISPFSPKPLTPFQWEAQDSVETLNRKIDLLKGKMHWREVQLNWRDPRISRLETALAQGDRRVGDVIYSAWEAGARFDAWTDTFNYKLWEDQFRKSNLTMDLYTGEKKEKEYLPWNHLRKGISLPFLKNERMKASEERLTGDCRLEPCSECGLMGHPVCQKRRSSAEGTRSGSSTVKRQFGYGRKRRRSTQHEITRKIRLHYVKKSEVRFTSHLDTVRMFSRSFRRAGIPLVFSQGFHAHPRIATGPPLPLGFTSTAEYMDIEVSDKLSAEFKNEFNKTLHFGFEILETKYILTKAVSLNSAINRAVYRIMFDDPVDLEYLQTSINDFIAKTSFLIVRKRKKEEKKVDIRSYVDAISINDGIDLVLRIGPEGTAKVDEVFNAISPSEIQYQPSIQIERTAQYIENDGQRLTPMEII